VIFEIGVEGLIGEYATLKPYLASTYSREIFDQNPTKNRYKDVICNDLTRVIIKDGKGSDYIHANYVRGQCLVNTFICTQGPIMTTIADFWRMILFEHVSHIIMLCDTIEQGKMKCEQYWRTVLAQ
ncbi:Protein-tyrosine phosphatase, partial [Ostertagia ostertagi]